MRPVELVRVAVVGFEVRRAALPGGGALAPRDLERVGARGFVSGFGMTGTDLDNEIFGAVRDCWRGLLGRLAPIAGSFLG